MSILNKTNFETALSNSAILDSDDALILGCDMSTQDGVRHTVAAFARLEDANSNVKRIGANLSQQLHGLALICQIASKKEDGTFDSDVATTNLQNQLDDAIAWMDTPEAPASVRGGGEDMLKNSNYKQAVDALINAIKDGWSLVSPEHASVGSIKKKYQEIKKGKEKAAKQQRIADMAKKETGNVAGDGEGQVAPKTMAELLSTISLAQMPDELKQVFAVLKKQEDMHKEGGTNTQGIDNLITAIPTRAVGATRSTMADMMAGLLGSAAVTESAEQDAFGNLETDQAA